MLERLLDKFSKRLEKRRVYRSTVKELNKLSDRELQDIGIHRGMIHSVAGGKNRA